MLKNLNAFEVSGKTLTKFHMLWEPDQADLLIWIKNIPKIQAKTQSFIGPISFDL